MKVAIVGLGATHDLAPWEDSSWQKWGLPWDAHWPRLDRWFEMHDKRLLEKKSADYLQRVENLPCYTQENYPFDAVASSIGAYYFASSIAYMMALAIHEGAEEIALWGVSLEANEEYAYQRPNMEYLVGFARGKGIKVLIPEESALCKFGQQFNHIDRYGWLGD